MQEFVFVGLRIIKLIDALHIDIMGALKICFPHEYSIANGVKALIEAEKHIEIIKKELLIINKK